MSRYPTQRAGVWVQPVNLGYKAACCDCALVHRIDFRLSRGRIQFRVFRDDDETTALRKKRHISVRTAPRSRA